jgi:hypothetical protein
VRYKNITMCCSAVFFLGLLTACGPSDGDAVKLGFSDAKEMKQINDLGYKTKAAYNERYSKFGFASLDEMNNANVMGFTTKKDLDEALRFTPLFFKQNCIDLSAENYERNCLGKKVMWQGEITHYGSTNGVRIQLLQNGKKEIDGVKLAEIESKSLASKGVATANIGYVIIFVGLISKRNFLYPDIEPVTWYAFEENAATNAQNRIKQRESLEAASNVAAASNNFDQFGRNKDAVCRNFAAARQSCATAANYSQCMNIKDMNAVQGQPMWYADKESCTNEGGRRAWF